MSTVASAAITVTAIEGLDPELSALLTVKATQFKSTINLSCGSRSANAKALIEVMSLGAHKGTLVNIQAQGEDAQHALNTLIAVIQHYCS